MEPSKGLLIALLVSIGQAAFSSQNTKLHRIRRWEGTGDMSNMFRGTAGVDYPDYKTIPNTSFRCSEHTEYEGGMYADVDTQCQVYHVCHDGRKDSFLCGKGTVFNQQILACDYWYSTECETAPSFYYLNEQIGKSGSWGGQEGNSQTGYHGTDKGQNYGQHGNQGPNNGQNYAQPENKGPNHRQSNPQPGNQRPNQIQNPAQPKIQGPNHGQNYAQPGNQRPNHGQNSAQPGNQRPNHGQNSAQPGNQRPNHGQSYAQPGNQRPNHGQNSAQPGNPGHNYAQPGNPEHNFAQPGNPGHNYAQPGNQDPGSDNSGANNRGTDDHANEGPNYPNNFDPQTEPNGGTAVNNENDKPCCCLKNTYKAPWDFPAFPGK